MAFKLAIIDENGDIGKTLDIEGKRELEIVGVLPEKIRERMVELDKERKKPFGFENYDQIFLVKIKGTDDTKDFFRYRTYGLNSSSMEMERTRLDIGKFYEGYASIDCPFHARSLISKEGDFLTVDLSRLDREERDMGAGQYKVYSVGPFKHGAAIIEVANDKSPMRKFYIDKSGNLLNEILKEDTVGV